jgi:hypothetical protein
MKKIIENATCSICGEGFTPEQWDNRYTDPIDGQSDCHEHCFEESANDCIFMIGYYPADVVVGHHDVSFKQKCALNCRLIGALVCPYTKDEAERECEHYVNQVMELPEPTEIPL